MNLTALTADDRGIDRLIVEPLVAAGWLPGYASAALRLTMVESKTRKAAFLREVVRQLALRETVVETCRYEQLLTRRDLQESADVVTVRGVRVDDRMLSALNPCLRTGGAVFLFRSIEEGAPKQVPPPFVLDKICPLVEASESRLVILQKANKKRK